ncbi:MAG TPA: Hsp20/alpha crystallin family protein [Opitutaceae bacterium]|jgi:HSP20 family protein|nr:Hsp20/alpha crystallin family protein [Opitutaceae bacterium]
MSLFNTLIPPFNRAPAQRDGSVAVLKPRYEVSEADAAYALTVYLPGVAKDGLELTADAGTLTITGRRGWQQPEGWTALYREASAAPFELVLEHDNTLDAEKISAELTDGVLRASLPKAEAVKPRKIAVN